MHLHKAMPGEQSAISKKDRAGARRRGREFCLALLYASDVGGGGAGGAWGQAEAILDSLVEEWGLAPLEAKKLRPAVREFGRALCEEYLSHRQEIDRHIDRLSQGWTLERMPVVDRNILRMAMAELLYLGDIPVGATIDEAVDLAKEYGTADSGKFVNGILGTVARELQEARRSHPSAPCTEGGGEGLRSDAGAEAGAGTGVPLVFSGPGTTGVSPVGPSETASEVSAGAGTGVPLVLSGPGTTGVSPVGPSETASEVSAPADARDAHLLTAGPQPEETWVGGVEPPGNAGRRGAASEREPESSDGVRSGPAWVLPHPEQSFSVPTGATGDAEIERLAVQAVIAHEEAQGFSVESVETENRGYDLISRRAGSIDPHASQVVRYIEVKGRAGVGEIVLSAHEYETASRLSKDYWLYVVFNCTSTPEILAIQDPARLEWEPLAKVQRYHLTPEQLLEAADG